MSAITLRIDGMHCGACVRRVTQALQRVEGAEVQEVRIGAARMEVLDAGSTPALLVSIAKAGFSAHVEE
ncbi:heavy-metal-associated domain-containing protein [Acidobacterium sp. S8]|uniref:heavy-metal-associated domain-containing protein n=1 Tax=Acidobacterium sp. S8 TaxID=1641854 RepID=UPI00131D7AB7|nr:heavy metal-associated domain-containing protein [Acidobacterium sp. S8]